MPTASDASRAPVRRKASLWAGPKLSQRAGHGRRDGGHPHRHGRDVADGDGEHVGRRAGRSCAAGRSGGRGGPPPARRTGPAGHRAARAGSHGAGGPRAGTCGTPPPASATRRAAPARLPTPAPACGRRGRAGRRRRGGGSPTRRAPPAAATGARASEFGRNRFTPGVDLPFEIKRFDGDQMSDMVHSSGGARHGSTRRPTSRSRGPTAACARPAPGGPGL